MEKGARIQAHDPQGMEEARRLLPNGVEYCSDIYSVFDGADCAVLMTEWNAYRGLDLRQALDRMSGNVFVDLRNVYEPETMRGAGFEYVCVGR